jgi:hypothetical protein
MKTHIPRPLHCQSLRPALAVQFCTPRLQSSAFSRTASSYIRFQEVSS